MLSNAHSQRAINIFYCYAHEDRKLQYELSKHLTDFKWEGLTTEWGYLDISPGQEREKEIANHLDSADIILLLITPDFMASYHCHEVEMKRAIAKHRTGTARVIPILLRPVTWENAPFRDLQPLPTDKKPIMSWGSKGARDKAFSEVSRGIKRVVNHFLRYQQESRPQQPVIKPSADQLGYTTSQISVDHKQSGAVY